MKRLGRWWWVGAAVVLVGAAVFLVANLEPTSDTSGWELASVFATLSAVLVALFLPTAQRYRDRRERVRADRDETLRLMYMARLSVGSHMLVSPELAATIANSLASHSKTCSSKEAMHLASLLVGGGGLDKLDEQIELLCALIDTEPPGDYSTHGLIVHALKQDLGR